VSLGDYFDNQVTLLVMATLIFPGLLGRVQV